VNGEEQSKQSEGQDYKINMANKFSEKCDKVKKDTDKSKLYA
jgi:hypothetical protein